MGIIILEMTCLNGLNGLNGLRSKVYLDGGGLLVYLGF
jgi:hypothetical protein